MGAIEGVIIEKYVRLCKTKLVFYLVLAKSFSLEYL
jgi:hypothetical protein